MSKLLSAFVFLLFITVSSLNAQITAKGLGANQFDANLPEIDMTDLSIFADEDTDLYFIDFEQLAVNLNQIAVVNQNGIIIWQEDVYDLPVNSIYELDFSSFPAGDYTLELRAYTGVIRKEIQHRS